MGLDPWSRRRDRSVKVVRAREVTQAVASSFEPGSERHDVKSGGELGTGDIHIGVEGIELRGTHGVYPDEQERGNRFRIDVDATGRWADAVRSDDLRDTLDVDAILQHIQSVNQRRRFHLIESFAGAIADELLQESPSLLEVRVCVRKLASPDWGPEACMFAAVTKRRS